MANHIYPLAKEHFGKGEIAWESDTIRAALLSSSYTYSASHEFFSSASSAVIGTPVTLTGCVCSLGVFDADDVTFPAVPASLVSRLVVYKWTGNAATSALIVYIDNATALPFTGQGVDQHFLWDDNAGKKIFAWGDDC